MPPHPLMTQPRSAAPRGGGEPDGTWRGSRVPGARCISRITKCSWVWSGPSVLPPETGLQVRGRGPAAKLRTAPWGLHCTKGACREHGQPKLPLWSCVRSSVLTAPDLAG